MVCGLYMDAVYPNGLRTILCCSKLQWCGRYADGCKLVGVNGLRTIRLNNYSFCRMTFGSCDVPSIGELWCSTYRWNPIAVRFLHPAAGYSSVAYSIVIRMYYYWIRTVPIEKETWNPFEFCCILNAQIHVTENVGMWKTIGINLLTLIYLSTYRSYPSYTLHLFTSHIYIEFELIYWSYLPE